MDDLSPETATPLPSDYDNPVIDVVGGVVDGAIDLVQEVVGRVSDFIDEIDMSLPSISLADGSEDGVDLSKTDSDLFFAAMDGVSGSPDEWLVEWFYQEVDGYCGPSSAAQIISQYTGLDITDPEQLMSRAMELGLMHNDDPTQGMTLPNLEILLEDQGVPASIETSSMADLAERLDSGHGVIAMVDSGEIWGTDVGPEDNKADHVLVVAGIDHDRGVVILSDPGVSTGNGLEVPIAQFEDAWEDSGFTMLVADEPSEGLMSDRVQEAPSDGRRAPWAAIDLRKH